MKTLAYVACIFSLVAGNCFSGQGFWFVSIPISWESKQEKEDREWREKQYIEAVQDANRNGVKSEILPSIREKYNLDKYGNGKSIVNIYEPHEYTGPVYTYEPPKSLSEREIRERQKAISDSILMDIKEKLEIKVEKARNNNVEAMNGVRQNILLLTENDLKLYNSFSLEKVNRYAFRDNAKERNDSSVLSWIIKNQGLKVEDFTNSITPLEIKNQRIEIKNVQRRALHQKWMNDKVNNSKSK